MEIHRSERKKIEDWFGMPSDEALLIWGLPGIGKTTLCLDFLQQRNCAYRYFDFRQNDAWAECFRSAMSSRDLLLKLSDCPISGGSSAPLYVFDGIDNCPEVLSKIKSLIQERHDRFILICRDYPELVRRAAFVPVGFLRDLQVLPSPFEEFFALSRRQSDFLRKYCLTSIQTGLPLDPALHSTLISVFEDYLVVGGFPEAMKAFFTDRNLAEVKEKQQEQYSRILDSMLLSFSRRQQTASLLSAVTKGSLSSAYRRFVPSREIEDSRSSRLEKTIRELTEMGLLCYLPIWDGVLSDSRNPRDTPLYALYLSDPSFVYVERALDPISGSSEPSLRGALLESYVFNELSRRSFSPRRFAKKNAAADFVFSKGGFTYLVDVKYLSKGPRFLSLQNELTAYPDPAVLALGLSLRNDFSVKGRFHSLPLYALPFYLEEN